MESFVDTTLGKYKLLSITDKNSSHVTFDAIDLEENRKKIVKIFKNSYIKEEKQKQLLYSKLVFVSKLKHRNLIVPEDIGYEKGVFYAGFPFIERNLAYICEKSGSLTSIDAIYIIQEVAHCLKYIHDNNILHFNINPFTIYMSGNEKVPLSGLGFIPAKEFFLQSDIMDCPFYVSPELISQKKISPVVDLYSLGATMFHLLTGTPPFEGNTTEEIFQKILYTPAPSLIKYKPSIFEELDVLVHRLLTQNPEEKITSANQLIEIVEEIAKQKNIKVKSPKEVEDIFILLLQKNTNYIGQIVSIFETIVKQKNAPAEVKKLMEKIAIQEISEKLNCDPQSIKEIKDCQPLLENPRQWIQTKLDGLRIQNTPQIEPVLPSVENKISTKAENESSIIKSRSGEYMEMINHNTPAKESNIVKTNRSSDYMKMFNTPLNNTKKQSSLTQRNQVVDFETYKQEKEKRQTTSIALNSFKQQKEKRQTTSIALNSLPKKDIKRETSHIVLNSEQQNQLKPNQNKTQNIEKQSFLLRFFKSSVKFFLIFIFVLLIVIGIYIFLSPELQKQLTNWFFLNK